MTQGWFDLDQPPTAFRNRAVGQGSRLLHSPSPEVQRDRCEGVHAIFAQARPNPLGTGAGAGADGFLDRDVSIYLVRPRGRGELFRDIREARLRNPRRRR